ncbi:MAG: hypothetical protein HY735_03440 [Verrucomicrobia bacterium]|nr:hypothetical protein [Verrucomicrobiota bacterium]
MNLSLRLLLFALSSAVAAMGAEYKIQLQRRATAGQQFLLSARFQETHKAAISAGGRALPEQRTDFIVEVDSFLKILETDPKGRVLRASCTISNCVRVEGTYKRELLPPKTVVMVSSEAGRAKHLVDGKSPDSEVARTLALTIDFSGSEPSDDEIFGTNTPKKIGESWDIHTEPMVLLFRRQNLNISAADIQGRTTLEQISRIDNVDCLDLAAKVYIKKFRPNVPQGMRVKTTFGAFRFWGKFPLDLALAPLEENMETSFEHSAQGTVAANLPPGTLKGSFLVKRTVTRRYF